MIEADEINLTLLNGTEWAFLHRLIDAFPKLEERFEEILKILDTQYKYYKKYLVKCFPERLFEILEDNPPKNISELINHYLQEVSQDKHDMLIRKYEKLISVGKQAEIVELLAYATAKKKELFNLLYPSTIKAHQKKLMMIDCPNPENWLDLDVVSEYEKNALLENIKNSAGVVRYLLEYSSLLNGLNLSDLKSVNPKIAREMYEKGSCHIYSISDVLELLKISPEYYEEIADAYSDKIARAGVVSNTRLPGHIVSYLFTRFPNITIEASAHYKTYTPLMWLRQLDSLKHQSFKESYEKLKHFFQMHQGLIEQAIHQNVLITDISDMDRTIEKILKHKMGSSQERSKSQSPEEETKEILNKLLPSILLYEDASMVNYSECTKLTIGMLDQNFRVDLSLFPNVRHITINLFDAGFDVAIEFFNEVKAHCPMLKSLNVPMTLEAFTSTLPYMINVHQYLFQKKSPRHAEQLSDTLFGGRHHTHFSGFADASMHTLFNAMPPLLSGVKGKEREPGDMYMYTGRLSEYVTSSRGANNRFSMEKVGKLLNAKGAKQHRIRTAIIELSKDYLTDQAIIGTLQTILPPALLTNDVKQECQQQSRETHYYQFQTSIKKGVPCRLLSVSTEDSLIAISDTSSDMEIFRGSDDFYYVQCQRYVEIEYIISAPAPIFGNSIETFGQSDPIYHIIQQYIASPYFKEQSYVPSTKRMDEDIVQWFERLYLEPGGSCKERCNAVWYQIQKDSALKDRVRIVRIDNNHRRLEIKHFNGQWLQIELGGIAAQLDYQRELEPEPYSVAPYQSLGLEFFTAQGLSFPTSHRMGYASAGGLSLPSLSREPKREADALKAQTVGDSTPQDVKASIFTKTGDHFTQRKRQKNNPPSSRYRVLKNQIKDHKRPINIEGLEKVRTSDASPVLMIYPNRQQVINEYLKSAKAHQQPVFVFQSPLDVKVGKDQVHVSDDTTMISMLDALDVFLSDYAQHPNATLLFDWAEFKPQHQVAFNTVLDKQQSLYGKKFNLRVISLCESMPSDNSFLSRHQRIYEPVLSNGRDISCDEYLKYDLQGLPHWQKKLFGDVCLVKNQAVWQKSDFVLALENKQFEKDVGIILMNIPVLEKMHISRVLKQAKAQGFFIYHHHRIDIPQQVHFILDKSTYPFSQLNTEVYVKNAKAENLPMNTRLVNTTVFDMLLTDKEIDMGVYHKLPGLIETSSNQELILYLSSNLSENQWYCLFQQAEKYQVSLYLYLADKVKVPSAMNTLSFATDTRSDEMITYRSASGISVITSKNPKLAAQYHAQSIEKVYVFAIEDYNYQDLISFISYDYLEQSFTNFEKQESQLFQALKNGATVILYGEFSKSMLQSLEPFLFEQALNQNKSYSGQLILSIDEKKSSELAFLSDEMIHHVECGSVTDVPVQVLFSEKSDKSLDLNNSDNRSLDFMEKRIHELMSVLFQNPITHVEGHTGVGKTFLIETIKQRYVHELNCYHEITSVHAWAQDNSDKLKLLFLDEMNIANRHLTFLSPLLNKEKVQILFDGVIYDLSDKHRVVCASNPLNYGGGRKKQKLFAHGEIPKIILEELPYYFIYEENLKPFHSALSMHMTEDDFKIICGNYLNKYHQKKYQQGQKLCVRDLQEWVITYCMQYIKDLPEKFFKLTKPCVPEIKTDLVITASMQPMHKGFRCALEVRKQRFLHQSSDIAGKNGVLIEGRPGMGKSDLVRLRLNKSGYVEETPGQAPQNPNAPSYIKIDASLPDDIKKLQIQQAFHYGQCVWLDEVNSTLDAGFEQWINAFLSGLDPDTHEAAARAGFMLIVTANSIGMEGRSLIGPALRGRLNEFSMPEPQHDDFLTIIQAKLPELELNAQIEMASDLAQLFEEDKQLTLREITPKLSEFAEIYSPQIIMSAIA